jgi:hypothetical protein
MEPMLLNAYRIDPLMTRIHDHPRATFDASARRDGTQ